MGLFDYFRKRKGRAGEKADALVDEGKRAYAHRDYSRALSFYQQALDIYSQVDDQWSIAICLDTIGQIYDDQGDKSQALNYYSRALDIYLQQSDSRSFALCLIGIGQIYNYQGDPSQALSYYQQALDIFHQTDYLDGVTLCVGLIGEIDFQAQGDASQALSYYFQALDIFWRRGHRKAAPAFLNKIGLVHKAQGDYPQALSYYYKALNIDKSENDQGGIAACLYNIGEICELQGDYSQALSFYQQALDINRQLDNQHNIANCLGRMGGAYLQQGDHTKACRSLVEAISVVEQMRQKAAGGRQQQIGLFERFLGLYVSLIERILWPQEDYGEALEYVERVKARTLVELLAEQGLMPSAAAPPELVQEYKRLHQRQGEIDFRLEQEGRHLGQRLAALRVRQEVAGKLSSLLEKIGDYDPDFTATVRVEPISVQDIQSALPDNQTALVELFMGREKTLAFIVTKAEGVRGVEVKDCSPPKVQALADRWQMEYTAFREGRCSEKAWCHCMDEGLQDLYTRLFVPIQQALPRQMRRLIFVPHFLFHIFPLHAMYREERGNRVYLLEEYEEVSYAPSAAIWLRCQQRHRPVLQRLVAVENPTGDLAYAEAEVEAIAPLFAERVILGPKRERPATTEVFLEEASRAQVVLCATHSSSGDPRSAHVKLSCGQELTLIEQFLNLKLPECSLWDYSSCETALPNELHRSDEWITLASGPLSVGAPTVWSTLWVVDDFATAHLKQRAYTNLLQRGMNKVQALNEAQRWFLRGGVRQQEAVAGAEQTRFALQQAVQRVQPESPRLTEKHRHPFYWAAFVVSGAR